MIRLSIIIPFYNVEQYIAQCLDSVYQQDIPEEEYEVICVNDASPDNSREIVKEYQKKHKNLILVEHEVNKKLGAARNTGRAIAKGKYIWNVDSDDMIAPNCLGEMLGMCEKEDLDVLMFGVYRLWRGKIYNVERIPWDESILYIDGISFLKGLGTERKRYISQVWTQIYKRSYLDTEKIYSPEINMGEDVPYTYSSILLASRLKAINVPYYIYRDNSESLTGVLRKHPHPMAIYENSFVCGAYMYNLLKRIEKRDIEVKHTLKPVVRYIILLYTYYGQLLSSTERHVFLDICRKNYVRNLFVYQIMNARQAYEYTKFIITGVIPKYR